MRFTKEKLFCKISDAIQKQYVKYSSFTARKFKKKIIICFVRV